MVLRDKEKWTEVIQMLKGRQIAISNATNTEDDFRIDLKFKGDYKNAPTDKDPLPHIHHGKNKVIL